MRQQVKFCLAILIIIAMIGSLFPTSSYAVESQPGQQGINATESTVRTWEELKNAITNVDAGEAAIITVEGNLEQGKTGALYDTLYIKGDITLKGGTIVRKISSGKIFVISTGAKLTLQDITLDGNKDSFTDFYANSFMINVEKNGQLVMEKDAVIKNSTDVGVYVDVNAEFIMNGGEISGCRTDPGVKVTGGSFTMNDGLITGNGLKDSEYLEGGGVYISGKRDPQTSSGSRYDGYFTMNGGEISTNYSGFGAGVFIDDGDSSQASRQGGAGHFKMTDGVIKNNVATESGGGVYYIDDSVDSGSLEITGGEISGNSATTGGGLNVYTKRSTAIIKNCVVSGNKATEDGGGILARGDYQAQGVDVVNLTIGENTIISNNSAENDGGGIMDQDANIILNCVIENNEAENGGGIFCTQFEANNGSDGSVVINGGTIKNNTATTGAGGGIYYDDGSTSESVAVTMNGGSIIENKAATEGGGVYIGNRFVMNDGVLNNNTATQAGDDIVYAPSGSSNRRLLKLMDISEKKWLLKEPQGTITGWFLDAETNRWNMTDAEELENLSYDEYETVYLKAAYAAKSLSYKYDESAPEGAPALPSAQNVPVGSEVEVSDMPSMDGYVFTGWTVKDGPEIVISDGNFIMPDKNIVLVGSWQKVVTVAPKDQTIYTGGHSGSGTGNEFPHPIYLVGDDELSSDVTFMVDGIEWDTSQSEYPFTVKYYDEANQEITTDERSGDFTAKIAPVDGVYANKITTSDGEKVEFDTGTLRIRYVSDYDQASNNLLINEALTYTEASEETVKAQAEASGEATALLPEGTEIYLNGDKSYPYPADIDSKISLFFDDLLPASANGSSLDFVGEMTDHAEALGFEVDGKNVQFKYLDLVDSNNSNAWVSSSAGSEIFWPYPEGCSSEDEIQLLHFKGLHREYRMGNDDTALKDLIAQAEVEAVDSQKTDAGIWFSIPERGFSPFALVWDEKSEPSWPDWPDWPPVGPGDDDDDNDDGDDNEPPILNTQDHFSYVVGYAEDYRTGQPTDNEDLWPVKPQNNITRAEVASIFYRLLKEDVRDENTTNVSDFSDVKSSDWYGTTVATLADMGIVKGYEDGTFRPNAPITRAEFAAIATRFFEETGATYEPGTFTDVTGSEWFAGAIMDAVNLGLIGGYEDGTVRPNNNITRAEACAIVNRTLGRVPDADHLLPEDEMKTWPDNPESAWFYADMQEATNGHEYEWITEDGNKVESWTDLLDKEWNDR